MVLRKAICLTAPLMAALFMSTTSAAIYSGMSSYTMNKIDATDRSRLSDCIKQLAPYKNTSMSVWYYINTKTNQQVAIVNVRDHIPIALNALGISGEYDFGRYGPLPSWRQIYSINVKFPLLSNNSLQPDTEQARVFMGFFEQGDNICLLTN